MNDICRGTFERRNGTGRRRNLVLALKAMKFQLLSMTLGPDLGLQRERQPHQRLGLEGREAVTRSDADEGTQPHPPRTGGANRHGRRALPIQRLVRLMTSG